MVQDDQSQEWCLQKTGAEDSEEKARLSASEARHEIGYPKQWLIETV